MGVDFDLFIYNRQKYFYDEFQNKDGEWYTSIFKRGKNKTIDTIPHKNYKGVFVIDGSKSSYIRMGCFDGFDGYDLRDVFIIAICS